MDFVCELLDGVRPNVRKIEKDAGLVRKNLLASLPNTAAAKLIADDVVSRFLHRRYDELGQTGALQPLHEFIQQEQRPDTQVDWGGFGAEKFGMLFKTQPLNRLLARQVLLAKGRGRARFEYRQEKLRQVRVLDQEKTSGPRYEAELVALVASPEGLKEGKLEKREYHQVIVRYGAEPALGGAFPAIDLALRHRASGKPELDDERREEWVLGEDVRKFWWEAAKDLPSRSGKRPAMRRLHARFLRTVAKVEHEGQTLECQKIRLCVDESPDLITGVTWVDYLLHTKHDKGEPLRRRATRGPTALRMEPFALSVFTWDDYEIEAKLSDGSSSDRRLLSTLLENTVQVSDPYRVTTDTAVSFLKAADALLQAEEKSGKEDLLGKLRGSAHRLRDEDGESP